MKTFKYKWSLDGEEFVGARDCIDETALKQHITRNGGKLVEIIEVSEKPRPTYASFSNSKDNGCIKRCPFCKEAIQAAAIKCKHCGEMLNRTGQSEKKWSSDSDVHSRKPPRGSSNGLAITSFVLGILAVITGIAGIGFLFAVIAVCLGPGGRDSEHGALASWGIYLGWFVIICFIIVVLFWILFFGGIAFLVGMSGAR